MLRISLFALGIFCTYFSGIAAAEKPRPEHLTARHTEGKGLGYTQGYSSIDLFLSQPFSNQTVVPFVDLRGHIFNDGRYAANAGVGFRILRECSSQVWGIYGNYDYLQTSHRIYNQVGGGLEVLGEQSDARINAYVPVGGKRKNIYQFEYENFGEKFGLKAREQLALKGIDSLFGYRYCKESFGEFHIGAGPYYYWGNSSKTTNAFSSKHRHTVGGRLAASVSFWDYLILEAVGSYDAIFRWCGQAAIALNIPFDFTFNKSSKNSNCYCLRKRLYESVARNEIIAVKNLNRFTDDPRVLDPEFEP